MHVPVMVNEVIEYLDLPVGAKVIDANLGTGGHTRAVLDKIGEAGQVLAIDRDADALKKAEQRLGDYQGQVIFVHDNFANMSEIAQNNGFEEVDGILFDLGLSSLQLDSQGRGFSWRVDEPLDMRMDQTEGLTAAELINNSSEAELADMFYQLGEERYSRQIAKAIVTRRQVKEIETTFQLAELVAKNVHHSNGRSRTHPAKKVFQALRIAVNNELSNLKKVLPQAVSLLKPGGRLAVISFHSLEDRIVKHFFKEESRDCQCPNELPICRCQHKATVKILTRKPLVPADEEVSGNPRSRSAKLRVIQKK